MSSESIDVGRALISPSGWGRLSGALNLLADRGTAELQAKTLICGAMACLRIRVRAEIAGSSNPALTDSDTQIPSQLSPDQLDWTASKTLGSWTVKSRENEAFYVLHRTSEFEYAERDAPLHSVTNAFSKKFENHCHSLALYFHNCKLVHTTPPRWPLACPIGFGVSKISLR
jgi:hypothetical protein